MRRFVVGVMLCVGAMLCVAGVAGAQTYPPDPGDVGVGGEVATRAGAGTGSGAGSDGTSPLLYVGVGAAVVGGGLAITTYRRRASLGA